MKVVSALTDNKVALWDRDPRHPDGEVWVVGDRVVDVGLTPAVRRALKEGRIVEVEETEPDSGMSQGEQTVDEVLAAVEGGELSAELALEAERARSKPRVTLVRELEAMLEGADRESEPDSEDADAASD